MWRPVVERVQTAVTELLTELEDFVIEMREELFDDEDNISWEGSDQSSEWGCDRLDSWGKFLEGIRNCILFFQIFT